MAGPEFVTSSVAALLLVLLLAAVITDLKTHRIPNLLLIPALGISVLIHTLGSGLPGLIDVAGGLLVGMAMLLPVYMLGGMGAGDVKLLGVVGSLLGPWGAVVAGLATMMSGAVLGIGVILWQRLRPLLQPYAQHLINEPTHVLGVTPIAKPATGGIKTTKIAYSPAIAAGTALALWYMGDLPMKALF